MDADIQGCINEIDKSWKCFEHNGSPMTKSQVCAVLQYGKSKNYEVVSEISDDEINSIINELKG